MINKTYMCPGCGKEHNGLIVRSKDTKIIKKDLDFCMHYKGENNPNFYKAKICPNCGLCYTKDFSISKNQNSTKTTNFETDKYIGKKRNIDDAIMIWEQVLRDAQQTKQNENVLGQVLLMLAWLYRYKDNKKEEVKFLKIASKFLEKTYIKENSTLEEKKLIQLLVAINVKIKDKKKAQKWLEIMRQQKKVNYKLVQELMLEAKKIS